MHIKDVEQRTGLSRANIRYYEQEGLVHPARRKNGYRDYSPDDLETLLRIRLLRRLDVPITGRARVREFGATLKAMDDLRQNLTESLESQWGMEQQRRLELAALTHDLKTPLTSVLGYLNLLHDDPGLTAEQRAKYTGIALDKARRLEELISEFFDITRKDLQGAGQERCVIHLSILLEQLADEFYPLFAEKGLTCRTDITPQLTTRGDPDKLARVFDNVLRNAVVPTVAFLAMTVADIVAGSVIIEQVFAIPGIGRLLLTSIANRDFPVVQAIVVILALWVVLVNCLADILNQRLDPRLRLQ